MLRIRLSRTGKKKQPSYRVVVADSQAKRDGRVVERIGHYNPRIEPVDYTIDEGRALYWLSVGAQPSDAVNRLLVKQGTIDRLGRLRQGESMDSLVAEFTGVEVETKAEEPEKSESVIAAIVPDVIEEVVEYVVEAVQELITDEEE
jgi:small subunit ribosomal protein S16